ncbi:hypothetical protein [Streptomyces sp. WELS2]|uniref:hypothetical protein n=1 Tax=Streptomyces sp. WELS2 TaxID=2749435 RepID=UPI0015F0049F|nr:hypothetical protein [Streptomyces sp. WELS2]
MFGNTCVTLHHLTRSVGTTAHSAGLGGNLAQLPLGTSYQHCGGAGLPDESLRRSAAGGLVGPDLPVNALHGG